MFDFETLSALVFLLILGIVVIIDRKNIEFKYGVMLRRTQKGKELIYKIGKKYKNILKKMGIISIFVAIVASVIAFYLMLNSAYSILTKPAQAAPGVRFIIPKIPSEVACTYALCVPFWYWIIGILIILFSHELMHAFVARAENIKIDSFGFLSLIVLPGAFVEPDEKQLKRSSSLTKLKIFAAGSFGNLMIVLISTILIFASLTVVNAVMTGAGVKFETTEAGTPAYQANLKGTILEVNGEPTKTLTDFIDVLNKSKPGDEITITTTSGVYSLTAISNPDNSTKAYIGIKNVETDLVYSGLLTGLGEVSPLTIGVIDWFMNLFAWINFLNLGVGLINLLPLKPLDGGLIYEEIFNVVFKKKFPYLIKILSIITLSLLVINVLGPYLMSYITSVFLISNVRTG